MFEQYAFNPETEDSLHLTEERYDRYLGHGLDTSLSRVRTALIAQKDRDAMTGNHTPDRFVDLSFASPEVNRQVADLAKRVVVGWSPEDLAPEGPISETLDGRFDLYEYSGTPQETLVGQIAIPNEEERLMGQKAKLRARANGQIPIGVDNAHKLLNAIDTILNSDEQEATKKLSTNRHLDDVFNRAA